MTRESVVDAVAQIERRVHDNNLNADQLAQANAELATLQSRAHGLGMPTGRIQQLKLEIVAAMRNTPASASPAPLSPDPVETNDEPRRTSPPIRPPQPRKPERVTANRQQAIKDLFG